MSTFAWGEYGQQGAERQRQREELATRQAKRRQELEELRRRIPAWRDGVRQVEALLVGAREDVARASAATATAWDALIAACYATQRGECAYSSEGLPIADVARPEVARQKAAWEWARQAEHPLRLRVQNLEAEKTHYQGWISTAETMS